MKYLFKILTLFVLSIPLYSDNHNDENSFPGLVSSEIFKMNNGLDMHVERRKTCSQGTVAKHFHPAAGTLVFVLEGKSQSKSSGNWKTYENGEYWFERSDWVHGGETDAPDLGEVCSDILVIRVAESGKDHTVFIN